MGKILPEVDQRPKDSHGIMHGLIARIKHRREVGDLLHTMKRPIWLVLVLILLTLVSVCILPNIFSSARRPDEVIRAELLEATPLGTSDQAVDAYARKHFRRDNFFHWRQDGKEKELQVLYGCYTTLDGFPFSTCVRAIWRFDSNGQLTDVHISRWLDGP